MKITNVKDNIENKVRSILLDDGHFRCSSGSQTKSTSSTWSYFGTANNVGGRPRVCPKRYKPFVRTQNATTGITLIALVITIIVLLILAGITINLTIGENGILKIVEEAKQKESETASREKLELVLVDARIEKETNTNYNKEEFLTQMLENNNMTVDVDTIIVDNYIYVIDRENLVILDNLGRSEIKVTAEVKEYLGANEKGKYEINILLTIESNTDLQSIVIKKPDGTTFEIIPKGTKLLKDLTAELDETYIVTATTKDGKTETRTIIEKSVENIRTVEELVAFRDKVNTGLTYEGKRINVVNNLDLSIACGEDKGSWKPIGEGVTFKGIFDGNFNTISNLYAGDNDITNIGLFYSNGGTIQNIIMKDFKVSISNSIKSLLGGAIASRNSGTITNVGIESGSVDITANFSTSNHIFFGGISGEILSSASISNCYNNIGITVKSTKIDTVSIGGIIGYTNSFLTISNCYNTGTINVTGNSSTTNNIRAGGIAGVAQYRNSTGYKKGTILNCYNIAKISASGGNTMRVAGIIGQSRI